MMAFEPSKPAPWWRSPRIAAGLLVGALHIALIAAFVLCVQPRSHAPSPREVFLLFHSAPPPARLPQRIEPAPLARVAPPFVRIAPPMAITRPPPATTPLELSLFRCVPENLARLTPDERAHCGDAYSAGVFVAPDSRQREHPIARRRTLAGRAGSAQRRFDHALHSTLHAPGSAESAVMVDPLCVLRQLSDEPNE